MPLDSTNWAGLCDVGALFHSLVAPCVQHQPDERRRALLPHPQGELADSDGGERVAEAAAQPAASGGDVASEGRIRIQLQG